MAIGKPVYNILMLYTYMNLCIFIFGNYIKKQCPLPEVHIQIPNLLFQEFIQGCRWLDEWPYVPG